MIEMLSSHFNYQIIYCVCVCVCLCMYVCMYVYLGNDRKFAPPSVTATHGTVTGYNSQIKNVAYTTHTVSLF